MARSSRAASTSAKAGSRNRRSRTGKKKLIAQANRQRRLEHELKSPPGWADFMQRAPQRCPFRFCVQRTAAMAENTSGWTGLLPFLKNSLKDRFQSFSFFESVGGAG